MSKENTSQEARDKWNSGGEHCLADPTRYGIQYSIVDRRNANRVVKTFSDLDQVIALLSTLLCKQYANTVKKNKGQQ